MKRIKKLTNNINHLYKNSKGKQKETSRTHHCNKDLYVQSPSSREGPYIGVTSLNRIYIRKINSRTSVSCKGFLSHFRG